MEIGEFMDFTGGKIYFLEAMARTKHNEGITKSKREYSRAPIRDLAEYYIELEKMRHACKASGLKIYIYLTVNSRDKKKAYKVFKTKLADYENQAMNGDTSYESRISRIDEVWYKSCLQTASRGSKLFLLDIDTKDPETRKKLIEVLPVSVVMERETRSGYHWIVPPFDRRLVEGIQDVGVQTDGRLFVEAIGFE